VSEAETASLSAAWEARAREWLAFARAPGADVFYSQFNWPAFAELLPARRDRQLADSCGGCARCRGLRGARVRERARAHRSRRARRSRALRQPFFIHLRCRRRAPL
jgi:hypothetical protein